MMDNKCIVIIFYWHAKNIMIDVEIPLEISANELIIGLNEGFKLGMDVSDLSKCHLKTENPVTLLKGNKMLKEYKLHNATIIHYTS